MASKSIIVVAFALVAVSLTATTAFVTAESEETLTHEEKKPAAPQYSETCAHGHNGFNCKPTLLRADITDLQERVAELEKHVSRPR